MYQITHDVRRATWHNIIKQCQERPEHTTVKQWCFDNDISEKSYYYWLRKFRKEAAQQMTVPVHPTAFLKHKNLTIAVTNDISDSLLSRILFCGRRSDRLKGLLWMGNGFLLLYKRFESGTLSRPRTSEEAAELTEEQFHYLMLGLNPLNPKIQ